jgi:hypothetical protein
MPLGEAGLVYCNEYGRPIHIEKNFNATDLFMLDRVCEAEKKVFEELISADFTSVWDCAKTCFHLWFKNTKFFNVFLKLFDLVEIQDSKKYAQEINKLKVIHLKARTFVSKIKHFAKNPLAFFSKEKREEYQQKVLKNVIVSRIKELTWPQEAIDHQKANKKRNIFVLAMKNLIKSKGNKIFMGTMLMGLIFRFSFAFYNQFFASQVISCVMGGLSLVGGGAAVYYTKNSVINVVKQIKDAVRNDRKAWTYAYNLQARRNTLTFSRQRRVNKNKSNLFIQAFCDKYQQAITPEDIKKSRTDDGEFERINRKKRCVTALDRKIESDLFELNYMIFQCKDKSSNRYENIYYEMEDMLFAARKIYLEQKKKVPFQQVMEDYLVKEIKEGKVFDEVVKHLETKEIRFIKTPALKKALCQKLLRSRLKEIKDKRADLSYLQKQYFKLLLRGNQAKERE